jgi:23S rRNA (cytosine1962-C5)-methyltransferase
MNVYLKKGKERAVLQRHRWIFSGAIDLVDEDITDGDVVTVCDHAGKVLGAGYFNSASQITVRLLSFGDTPFSRDLLKGLLERAVARRKTDPLLAGTSAYRLVHSEGDNLPGLVVDSYDGHLVIQCLTLGIDRLRDDIIGILKELLDPKSIYERSDHGGRVLEGIEKRSGQVEGSTPDGIIINEHGMIFTVDVKRGQKTGLFLDQREHRSLARRLAEGRNVLNLFSYTGGFTVAAMLGGAKSVVSVDSSEGALSALRKNLTLNGISGNATTVCGDVFDYLRGDIGDADFIILDPPAFAKNRASIQKALRGYKDINLQAMRRCPAGTLLLTFSCSRFISMDDFQRAVFAAALDAGRDVSIIRKSHHPSDHPVSVYVPETEYLKGLLLRVE